MFNPSSTENIVSFPTELVSLRAQAATSNPPKRLGLLDSISSKASSRRNKKADPASSNWQRPGVGLSLKEAYDAYAAPLAPLRERDIQALDAMFDRNDMADIETDVIHNLLSLWPEPCWEDDPFEFLREYL